MREKLPEESSKIPIKLRIPSKIGFEKIAADCVVLVGREIGFVLPKIDDLKTAITEACLNAIEHGNKMDENIYVMITIIKNDDSLVIEVQDNGANTFEEAYKLPDLEKKINGKDRTRGWGLFLIRNLMDKVEIKPINGQGRVIRMTLYLNPPTCKTPRIDNNLSI